MSRYAVIDFETTGLSPTHDRAIEIAAVMVEGTRIVDRFQTLINPGVRVSSFITELTGITNDMLRSAPHPTVAMRGVHKFTGTAILVAHNANFDRGFWAQELTRIGLTANTDFLCTMLIARRLYPWASNHKLSTLASMHGISTDGHHRALADATMTSHLLMSMQKDLALLYPSHGVSPEFLRRYQRMKKSTAKSTARRVMPQQQHTTAPLRPAVKPRTYEHVPQKPPPTENPPQPRRSGLWALLRRITG